MSDLGPVSFYLRMIVTQDCTNWILYFGQQSYLERTFQDHGIWDCKAVAVLIDRALTVTPIDCKATNGFWT